ncbi:MAG TPA: hypothetical protein VIN06_05015 [Devosia sp.]
MRTVTGLFDTYEHAANAVHALKDAGIKSTDISFIANSPEEIVETDAIGEGATTGAELGAVLGGAGGLLAGLGILAIPGLGPVVAGGWLFAAAMGAVAGAGVGAATGGIVGALTGAGVPESDAHVYAEGLKRGGALVTARVDESRAEIAATILRDAEGVDIAIRRKKYEQEGWERFDETALPRTAPDAQEGRSTPLVPPII